MNPKSIPRIMDQLLLSKSKTWPPLLLGLLYKRYFFRHFYLAVLDFRMTPQAIYLFLGNMFFMD